MLRVLKGDGRRGNERNEATRRERRGNEKRGDRVIAILSRWREGSGTGGEPGAIASICYPFGVGRHFL